MKYPLKGRSDNSIGSGNDERNRRCSYRRIAFSTNNRKFDIRSASLQSWSGTIITSPDSR